MPTDRFLLAGQANLNSAASYSPAEAPSAWSDGDTLTLKDGGPLSSGYTNSTAIVGKNLESIKFTPGYSGVFGTEADPISVQVNNSETSILDYNAKGSGCSLAGGSTVNILWWRPIVPSLLTLGAMTVAVLKAFSGSVRAGGSTVLAAVEAFGNAVVEIADHASDVLGDLKMGGRSTFVIRRRLAGKLTIPTGCTVIYDVDTTTTTSQDVILAGGTLKIIRGSMVIDGRCGVLDMSAVAASGYGGTLIEYPDLVEIQGPIVPAFSRTVNGAGSKKQTV